MNTLKSFMRTEVNGWLILFFFEGGVCVQHF